MFGAASTEDEAVNSGGLSRAGRGEAVEASRVDGGHNVGHEHDGGEHESVVTNMIRG